MSTTTDLNDFLANLANIEATGLAAMAEACDAESLEAARIKYLGAKSGAFKEVEKQFGGVEKADKRAAGMRLNEVKKNLKEALQSATEALSAGDQAAAGPRCDVSLPGTPPRLGHVHPITQTIEHLKEIMGRMGFAAAEGPEVEDPWHNFVALNIPADHPARDPLENFYLATAGTVDPENAKVSLEDGGQLLRSQTSTVQIRVMETSQPPIRVISLGRVYRPDAPDATHYPMFHQMEGLLVDTHVTMANLKTVLRVFANNYLGEDVDIRFRPSFFPFTEPSVEVDFWWNDQWIEFGGAGMVDPAVLTSVGYDPDRYAGFAFGLGVERLCMRRHAITDIRDLYSGDMRFLSQF
ncbi:phenylalanine--tRNA ligase subunit alpha [Planctomycetaceae bacterium SH139]